MAVSVSYCHSCQFFFYRSGCQCFILSRESVFDTVMAVSASYCHCFQCFILSQVSVFHIVMAVSVSYCHIWVTGFHIVMAVRVLYCHEDQGFILPQVSGFILSRLSVFHTVMDVSVSCCHG